MLETPIKRITPGDLRTIAEDFEFDIIIYATRFDAVTGSFDRIDIGGTGGLPLRGRWATGPETLPGLRQHTSLDRVHRRMGARPDRPDGRARDDLRLRAA